jgi:hypothetical protein
MQIQSWEGAALSRAETVLHGTTHDTERAEIDYGEKVSQRLWSKKAEEGIGLPARQRESLTGSLPVVTGEDAACESIWRIGMEYVGSCANFGVANSREVDVL